MATPIANDDIGQDGFSVFEDEILRVSGKGVLANDTDADNDKLAAHVTVLPHNPLFDLKTSGAFTYDARFHGQLYVDGSGELTDVSTETSLPDGFDSLAAGATVTDTFTYEVSDGILTDTAVATVTITGVNDDPVADDDADTVNAGATTRIDALDGDTDVDIYPVADTLTITGLSDIADDSGPAGGTDNDNSNGLTIVTDAGGTVTLVEGQLDYRAATGFFGIDTFEYTVGDGHGGSDTGVVRVTVLPVNQAPVAVDDSYTVGEAAGATDFTSPTVLANDTDSDDAPLIAAELVAGTFRNSDAAGVDQGGAPKGILVDFNSDGTFTYNPNGAFTTLAQGESAWVAFDYIAYDGKGAQSQATVVIEIQGANDGPQAGNPPQGTVYEAGLTDGSGDGTTTTVHNFDFLITDPDSTPILAFSSDGTQTSPSDDMYGTWTILDGDTVSYTLTGDAPHADVGGHNGGVTESVTVYIVDGSDFITRTITAEIIDDINFLATLPNGATGADTVDDKTVSFSATATASDTFTHVQGADGATFEITGVPGDFTLGDGRVVSSSVDATASDPTVVGTDDEGNLFYTIVFDPDDGDDTGSYQIMIHQNPPMVVGDVDFSAISAGGPQEYPFVPSSTSGGSIGFNGGFFTDGGDISGTFVDDPNDDTGDDDINPNNAGGIGVGNGNIDRLEALVVDVTQSASTITGIELDVKGVGGGIGTGDLLWEAVLEDGTVVASDSIDAINFASRSAHTLTIDPGVAFDFLYVALDPADFDSNDTMRINRIATIEEESSDDYKLGFSFLSDEGTQDGDASQEETFFITLDGDTMVLIDPGIIPV